MQYDEHFWTWYRHHRDAYTAQPLPTPEFARLILVADQRMAAGAPGT